MKKSNIHPTAVVHPDAKMGDHVEIGPYSIIASPHVVLEDGVVLKAHVYVDGYTRIKKGTVVWPFTSIGGPAQHLKESCDKTYTEIGENCTIRESVTINAPYGEDTKTIVGNNCYLMAYAHVAHNCIVGNHVIMTNGATLGGHVEVGDHANLGGHSAIYQRTRIGSYAMVGGGSLVRQDLPPFCMGVGYPLRVTSLNVVGLRRNQFSVAMRRLLIATFRLTFQSALTWKEAKTKILEEVTVDEHVQTWIDFCDHSVHGIASYLAREGKQRNVVCAVDE